MFTDLFKVLKRHESWLFMGWMDIVLRYRRTTLGPFWLVLATFFSIIPLAFIAATLFKSNFMAYFPYVACGMVVWTYMTVLINESCHVFIEQDGIIKNVNAPILSFCIRLFVRNTIAFFHSLLVILIIITLSGHLNYNFFYFFPGLFLFAVNAFSLSIILGFLTTRMRDVVQVISAIISLLTVVTPIIWKPDMLSGTKALIVQLNPLYHFVSILREPLLGGKPSLLSMEIVICFTAMNLWFAKRVYDRYRTHLVFWL